jgi:hypothetical protein
MCKLMFLLSLLLSYKLNPDRMIARDPLTTSFFLAASCLL